MTPSFISNLQNMFNGGASGVNANANPNNMQNAPGPIPANTVSPGNVGNVDGTMGGLTAPNGTDKSAINPQDAARNADDAMYTQLWETDPNAPKAPEGYLPKIDPVKVREQFSKLNFVNGVNPELLATAEKGGQEGMAAMMQIINAVGQTITERVFNSNYSLLDKALPNAFNKFEGGLDSKITRRMSGDALAQNPIMVKPEYKPMVESIRDQLASKNPQLTAEALTEATSKYFDRMAEGLGFTKNAVPDTPNNSATGKKSFGTAPGADWMDWLSK